jgi:two-component system, LytTR family, sensor kinase
MGDPGCEGHIIALPRVSRLVLLPSNLPVVNKKIAQVIIHIAAWGCFLMLPLVFFPRPLDTSFLPEQAFSLFFVLSNLFYIAFYYVNANLLIPKLLERKKIIPYTLIIVALLIFCGSFPRLYHYFFGDIQRFTTSLPASLNRARTRRPSILSGGSIAIFLLVFIFSTAIRLINQWFKAEQRNKQIENEKLNTELSFLKAQINPHFLFNTLNNIYSLAEDKSDKTPAAVMKLSNIMRYVLTEAKNDSVPLEKEIQLITDYLDLQKLRVTSKTSIHFEVQGDPRGKKVSPLLFLPFVENAFKYGVSNRELSPIQILLTIADQHLQFMVSNYKHLNGTIKETDKTGIGINNTRRRLELLYPDRYAFDIQDEAASYTINLNILLS